MYKKVIFEDKELELLEKALDWLIANAKDDLNRRMFYRIYKKIEKANTPISDDGVVSYMSGASDSAIELYNHFMKDYNKDLYHSITAVIEGYKKKHSEEAVTEESITSYYIEKYKKKRPILLEYDEGLKDMIAHVFSRLSWK